MVESGVYSTMQYEIIKKDEKTNAIALKLKSEDSEHITRFIFDDISRKSFYFA